MAVLLADDKHLSRQNQFERCQRSFRRCQQPLSIIVSNLKTVQDSQITQQIYSNELPSKDLSSIEVIWSGGLYLLHTVTDLDIS